MNKNLIIILIALSLLIGSSYQIYLHLDFTKIPDAVSYFRMAEGDFTVTITHRYRLAVPMLAKLISLPIEKTISYIWPHRAEPEWALRLGFFIINTVIMSLASLMIFKVCRAYGASVFASLAGMTAVLVSRWAVIFAAIPWTDSLYLFVIALSIYGAKTKNNKILMAAILLGPFAKESYIFFAPVLCLAAVRHTGFVRLAAWFVLSGILVFTFRAFIDHLVQVPAEKSLNNAFSHFENIPLGLQRLGGIRGLGEIFSIWGLFTLILISGFAGGKLNRESWMSKIDIMVILTPVSMLLHAVLSTEVGRMIYFASPVFAVSMALILDNHGYYKNVMGWIGDKEQKKEILEKY
jgi:hypothetical protein